MRGEPAGLPRYRCSSRDNPIAIRRRAAFLGDVVPPMGCRESRGTSMDLGDALEACRNVCEECRRQCLECGRACRQMPDMQACEELCERCATACEEAIIALAGGSNDRCGACAEACDRCAEECEKYGEQACYDCASTARRCEADCRSTIALGAIRSMRSLQ